MTKVYVLTFPNGKKYVGITELPMSARLSCHRAAKSGILRHALKKYGTRFTVEIVAEGTREEMQQRERELIASLGSFVPNGYNCTLGGDGFSSAEMKSRWADPEFRQKTSAAMRGKKHRAHTRALFEWTPEARKNLSLGQSRRWSDPTARAEHGRKVKATAERKRVDRSKP